MTDPSKKTVHTFTDGCMWEGGDWFIRENESVSEYGGGTPCKHCHSLHKVENRRDDGSTWTKTEWICPRVIVVMNEGGCNSTGLCLDCVLEQAKHLLNPRGALDDAPNQTS